MFKSRANLARAFDVSIRTIDRWTALGLLPSPIRGPNGRKLWPADVVDSFLIKASDT